MGTKADFRKALKSKLSKLSESEHLDLSQKVSRNLQNLLNDLGVIQKKLVTGVFAPIQQEPKWFLEIEESFEELTAYPAYADQGMHFKLTRLNLLKKSLDFGVEILGPDLKCPTVEPKVILVPGLGFTADGERLGRGKGFYDRYLENSKPIKIGVAFEIQIERNLPVDPHDMKMDFVVTDKNIYRKKTKESQI